MAEAQDLKGKVSLIVYFEFVDWLNATVAKSMVTEHKEWVKMRRRGWGCERL